MTDSIPPSAQQGSAQQPTPPQGWGAPTSPAPPAEPEPTRRRRWPWIAGILAAFVVGIGVGAAANSGDGNSTKTPAVQTPTAGPKSTFPSSAPTTVAETTPPPPTDIASVGPPKPSDFRLTVKTLKKTCFGSAGCNVTYRIAVAYSGPAVDPSTSYAVTYQVRGVEDGPQINTFTLTGDQVEVDSEEIASTTSAGARLTAVVTDVNPA